MIIILEGNECTGKSTLAKRLSEKTGYPIKHFGAPQSQEEMDNAFEIYKKFLVENDNLIVDRWWYSDMVYGPILRGKSTISRAQCIELELIWKQKGALLYICDDFIPFIMRRFRQRGDDLITEDQLCEIEIGYAGIWKDYAQDIPTVYYTVGDRI